MKRIIKSQMFLILAVLVILGTATAMFRPRPRPNNQYELKLYQDHYILLDGARTVKIIPYGQIKQLDTILLDDNR